MFEVNKMFKYMAFCFSFEGLYLPWALPENNALESANQSMHYTGYKHKP